MPEFVSIILRRSGRKEVWRTLPVTPSTITIDKPQGVRKDIIVNVGQIADIGVKRPKMISFNSFFPKTLRYLCKSSKFIWFNSNTR